MHSERLGSQAASPTLVFLHHGLGSIAQWRTFPATLCEATGLPGLLLDRIGHGQSAPGGIRPLHYLEDEAVQLAAALHALDAHRVLLVGHSDGATIALLHAACGADPKPLAVVSIAAHLFVEDITRAGIRKAVDNHAILRSRLQRYHGAKTDALFWNWAGTWLSPAFDAWDIRQQMPGVHCPVLALQGVDDEYGTIAQIEAIEAGCSGPVTRALIPDCGHDPHLQNPAATMQAIARWIAALNL